MGNLIDSRSHFEGGYLYVKTERPFYHAGERVIGKVYIRTMVPMNPSHLDLHIDGLEKTSHRNFERRRIEGREGQADEWEEVMVKEKHEHKNLEFKGRCFTFNGPLYPGDYTIPFDFTLPMGLPASIMYRNDRIREKPKAAINYRIVAILETIDRRVLKYHQMLLVHEPPVPFVEGAMEKQTVNLTNCCSSKGRATMGVRFNKNVFYSNEMAIADLSVDNSQAQVAAIEI